MAVTEISLYELISRINSGDGTVNTYEIFKNFREFVAKTARGKRRERILNISSSALLPCGIFKRLIYNFTNKKVEYICGQEWNTEMAILRDCFDRR